MCHQWLSTLAESNSGTSAAQHHDIAAHRRRNGKNVEQPVLMLPLREAISPHVPVDVRPKLRALNLLHPRIALGLHQPSSAFISRSKSYVTVFAEIAPSMPR